MEPSTLRNLPEGFTHLSKFRPADAMDFGRRAKNMAKVLKRPLQESQNILARAYGYADLHELQQVLKKPGTSGPYQDQLQTLSAGDEDIALRLKFYRDERLMRCLTEDREEPSDEECADLEVFACDLGLFSSPTVHRTATKAVLDFLESHEGFTQEGFPFGYNGVIHSRYRLWRSELDVAVCEAFTASAGYPFRPRAVQNPVEQLRQLRRYRASHIFIEMVKRTVPDLLDTEPEIFLDVDGIDAGEAELLLQSSFDFDVQAHLMRAYYGEKNVIDAPWDGEEAKALSLALSDPNDSHIQACAWTREILDFRTKLAAWRLSLRFQFAQRFAEGDFDDYFDIDGEPRLLTAGDGCNCLFLMMTKHETDEDFQRWKMNGMALRRTAMNAPWVPVGALVGEYFNPADNGHYSPPDHVLSYFDDQGNTELYRVWALLDRLYISRAGYENYGDWVNDPDGSALVNVRYWEPGESSANRESPATLELLLSAFQDGYSNSWDSKWERFGLPDERAGDFEDINESDYEFPAIGVVFLPQPGTEILGYSVWDGQTEAATTQLLRFKGARLGRGSRRYASMSPEKTEPGWDVLERVKALHADFVLYDPKEQAL